MANNTIPMGEGHGWKTSFYNNGLAGAPLPTDWKEVYITAWFGLNAQYCVCDHIIREQVDNNPAGAFRILHGAYGATNDYHAVQIGVNSNGVNILSWKYNGVECASQSPIHLFYRT